MVRLLCKNRTIFRKMQKRTCVASVRVAGASFVWVQGCGVWICDVVGEGVWREGEGM